MNNILSFKNKSADMTTRDKDELVKNVLDAMVKPTYNCAHCGEEAIGIGGYPKCYCPKCAQELNLEIGMWGRVLNNLDANYTGVKK